MLWSWAIFELYSKVKIVALCLILRYDWLEIVSHDSEILIQSLILKTWFSWKSLYAISFTWRAFHPKVSEWWL